MDIKVLKEELIKVISSCDNVLGIGQTGDINAPLVAGKSDIDLFVICDSVPDNKERLLQYKKLDGLYDKLDMEVSKGGLWGHGDIFYVNGIDVMPMYFKISEMQNYVEEVLNGEHLKKEGRFYPVGRLASIETINILWEKNNSWTGIVNRVKEKPQNFFDKWYKKEVSQIIDEEDLARAELHHEVLFYHQVIEEFLDHFLQTLYAKNKKYFPNRKRTEKSIENFSIKPIDCYDRLLKIVKLSNDIDSIDESIKELKAITDELINL